MIRILLSLYALYALAISTTMALRGHRSAGPALPPRAGRPIRRILVIGATGGTGQQLVRQALDRGYEVTALVRNPAKLELQHPQLRVLQGDVLDHGSVAEAVQGQDAVVSALGHRRLFVPSRVQSDGTRNVLRAMKEYGVQRFVCETALGLGRSAGRMGLFGTLLFLPVVLPIYFWDKSRQERIISESDLDWVIVRPGILTNGRKRGVYRHGENVGSYIVPGRISRADVADFMLNQLTDDTYLHKAPGLVW
jgi:putative NADH-flavin reductase